MRKIEVITLFMLGEKKLGKRTLFQNNCVTLQRQKNSKSYKNDIRRKSSLLVRYSSIRY